MLTHVVLAIIFGNQPWIWILTALDAYTVLWIGGVWTGYVLLPHRVARDNLHLRFAFVDDLVVPHAAIRSVRRQVKDDTTIKRMRVDRNGVAMFSCGEANVVLELDPDVTLCRRGAAVAEPIRTLHVTADEPDRFVESIRRKTAQRSHADR